MAGTYEVPEEGSPNSTQDPKIKAFIKGQNEKLNSSNLLEDSGLASPNNGAYRLVYATTGTFREELAAGTYSLSYTASTPPASGTNIASAAVAFFQFAKADYEVAGKTQKLRLRAQMAINATKPLIKFTYGLYPITVAGAANELVVTLGSVVSGSTVEFNEPAASTITSKESGDFTIPADGAYILGAVTSAKLTASAATKASLQLQTRSV